MEVHDLVEAITRASGVAVSAILLHHGTCLVFHSQLRRVGSGKDEGESGERSIGWFMELE